MAQLDRALDSDSKGCGFKSRQVHQIKKDRKGPFLFGCILEWDLNMERATIVACSPKAKNTYIKKTSQLTCLFYVYKLVILKATTQGQIQ